MSSSRPRTPSASRLTFEQVGVVLSVGAQEVELLGLGLGGQDGDGVAHVLDGDRVGGGHLARQSHLGAGHGRQAGADLVQPQQVAGALLRPLLQAQHDLGQEHAKVNGPSI